LTSIREVSIGTHVSPRFTRTGPAKISVFAVPSGRYEVVESSVRADRSSTGEFCSRAVRPADVASGRSVTGADGAAFATPAGADGGTANMAVTRIMVVTAAVIRELRARDVIVRKVIATPPRQMS
jgi:hypothetical protein